MNGKHEFKIYENKAGGWFRFKCSCGQVSHWVEKRRHARQAGLTHIRDKLGGQT